MKETLEFVTRYLITWDRPVPIKPVTKTPLQGDKVRQSEKGFP